MTAFHLEDRVVYREKDYEEGGYVKLGAPGTVEDIRIDPYDESVEYLVVWPDEDSDWFRLGQLARA